MISLIALWILVLFETGLLLLLLRALGELKQQRRFSSTPSVSYPEMGGLAVGEQAPSFVATDGHDNTVTLVDYQGQKRILAFISPGCPACPGAIKVLNAAMQEDQDLSVLALGSSDRKQNRAYAVEHEARMPILTLDSSIEREKYHVPMVPFVFVLDEAGIIRARGVVNEREHLQSLLTIASATVPIAHERVPR